MSKLQMVISGLLVFASVAAVAAERQLESAEKLLNTDGSITMQFHSALYYPNEISLQHDGFLIGVEKSNTDLISEKDDLRMRPAFNAGLKDERASKKFLKDPKILFISHILSRADGKTCDLYNAYRSLSSSASNEFDSSCATPTKSLGSAKRAYDESWSALDTLKERFVAALSTGAYDDIVVMTMGWNTPQDEAIRNINTLTRNLITAMRETGKYSYKPLVIGVTWPSQWTSSWVDPAVRVVSFPTKAEDADQLGLTWLGVLLHETIPDAQEVAGSKLNVIAIGHSFGSRAMSTAVCVGPAIFNTDPKRALVKIPLVINLEGAFEVKRLFGESEKGLSYPKQCANAGKYVMSASRFDKAVGYAKWGAYMGEASTYKTTCGKEPRASDLDCIVANSEGGNVSSSKRLVYILADELIYENAYMTGGGAHSDIFRKEHGVMLANIIRSANPSRVLRAPPVAVPNVASAKSTQ